ncbi:glucocorticoid receptor-like (DNA-binding domain), partial [Linnemannia elongata AG-77]
MTPSPRLPPRTSGSPGASSSPRSRKNSIGGSKREHKVGVTATSCANCGTTTTPLWRRAGNGQTICNACGLYFKARNLTRPTWLKRNTGAKKANRQHLVCANCRTTTTPLWRRDSSGNTICNACGLYFKLHNVHRPVTMKRAVIKRRKR